MALRIRIEHGQDAGKTWLFVDHGVYRFGRSPQTSVQILDMKVSKEHFEIVKGPAGVRVRDLGSSHGTLLNGQPVVRGPQPIAAGDEIRVGLTVLRVLAEGPADAEAKPVAPLQEATAEDAASAAPPSRPAAPPAAAAGPSAATPAPAPQPAAHGNERASAPAAPAPARGNGAKVLAPDALVGTVLAGYRILEKVGAGGMGAVYRAEQLSLHREVAIKILAEKLVSDAAFVDQFVNEARAAGQLNHPNVVQVYDVGQAEGRHFFSMEFIHGGSLESHLPRGGACDWQEVLPWFLDAANALIFAEKKGILHRDIKPDNFMLGQDGSVKLCDLGLAKKSESSDLLAQGIIGTPHFLAPEAIRRRSDADLRADLYSLGCTFYRLLTGKNPYPAASVKDILLAQLNAPVPRVSAHAPGVPKALDEIVFRLMQKDPAARFQSAQDLWHALDRVRLEFGLEAHGLHPGRAKKFAIAGGVVAVAAIATLIVLKPWEVKVETINTIERVEVPGGGANPEELRAAQALGKFGQITNAAFQALGKLDESWQKAGWAQFVEQYEGMAREFAGTPSAEKAAAEAKRIREFRERRQREEAEALAARRQAREDLEAVPTAVLARLTELAGKPLDAEAEIEKGLREIEKVAARRHADQPLVEEPERKGQEARIEEARAALAGQVRAAFAKAEAEAKAAEAGGTAQALAQSAALYEAWVRDHPIASGAGAVARAWNDTRTQAATAKARVVSRQAEARRRDLAADRQDYYTWLAKEAYAPRSEDGSFVGDYLGFRFAAAADRARRRAAAAKTPEYRALLEARAAEANRMGSLPGLLAQAFASQGYKDRLQGRGWQGVPKGFTPEGVTVGDKTRLYAEEGLAWFVELFFDKAQERFPLDADAWEGLGLVAEASIVLESPAALDRCIGAWEKAAEADPARADRLAKRAAMARVEHEVRTLLDGSDEKVATTADEIAKYEEAIKIANVKENEKVRREVRAREDELKKRLEDARSMLLEAETKHPACVGRALLADTVPSGAYYAGESPPAPPPAGPPATPPATPPTAPPAMGEAPPAMGETPPAMGETPPAMGEAPPAMGEAPPAMGETPPAMGETPPAMGEAPPVPTPGMEAPPAPAMEGGEAPAPAPADGTAKPQ